MDPSDDPFEILGITPDTDPKDIKKAYRKLAMQSHPDKQLTDEEKERAHQVFSKISAAYEVLSDPSKRHEWILMSRSTTQAQAQHPPDRRHSNQTPPPHKSRMHATHSPPPPSSPGLFRSRPKRTGSPSKQRENSPCDRRSLLAGGAPQSPGALRRRRQRSQSPGALLQHRNRSQSPGALMNGSFSAVAPKSPASFANRQRNSLTAPESPLKAAPGSIRPQGRPRPRPIGVAGGPRKHASTGTLRNTRSSSAGSLSPRVMGPEGVPRSRRQLSVGSLRTRKFRDPFLIFEEVMEEEFGVGYKSKAASGWNKDEKNGTSLFGGGEKKLSAKKEFKKRDLNGDQAISKDELRNFVESNEELWAVLGTKLSLKREACIRIATEVAFSLAKGEETTAAPKKRKSGIVAEVGTYELSESEFKAFYKTYVLTQKGCYDFFLRTIFAFYDINGDGVLQRDEFGNFLDLFYNTKDAYKQKLNAMPSKLKLLHIAEARLDKNKDGELSFEEVRDLLQVAVVITADNSDNK